MKTQITLFLTLMLLTSCNTTTRQTVEVKTLQAIAMTVDKEMSAYADMRVRGRVDDQTHAKVVDLKAKYEKTMALAIAAVGGDMSKFAPDDVIKISAELLNLLHSL